MLWIAPYHGLLTGSTEGEVTDEADILWASGPTVGLAMYQQFERECPGTYPGLKLRKL